MQDFAPVPCRICWERWTSLLCSSAAPAVSLCEKAIRTCRYHGDALNLWLNAFAYAAVNSSLDKGWLLWLCISASAPGPRRWCSSSLCSPGRKGPVSWARDMADFPKDSRVSSRFAKAGLAGAGAELAFSLQRWVPWESEHFEHTLPVFQRSWEGLAWTCAQSGPSVWNDQVLLGFLTVQSQPPAKLTGFCSAGVAPRAYLSKEISPGFPQSLALTSALALCIEDPVGPFAFLAPTEKENHLAMYSHQGEQPMA